MPPDTNTPPDSGDTWDDAINAINALDAAAKSDVNKQRDVLNIVGQTRQRINDILKNNDVSGHSFDANDHVHEAADPTTGKQHVRIKNDVDSAEKLRRATETLKAKLSGSPGENDTKAAAEIIAALKGTKVDPVAPEPAPATTAENSSPDATPDATPAASPAVPKSFWERLKNTYWYDSEAKPADSKGMFAEGKEAAVKFSQSSLLAGAQAAGYVLPTRRMFTKTIPATFNALNIFSNKFWLWEALGMFQSKK